MITTRKLNKIVRRPLKLRFISDYLLCRRSPARILCDDSMEELLPKLRGTVVELGGTSKKYSRLATSADRYLVTNISGDYDEIVDMLNMPYEDNSVDAFVSISSLEHVPNPWKAIQEIYRCLKPSGRVLLSVPFVFYFHAAPDDYYRFSHSALFDMLKDFNILRFEHLGGRASTIALLVRGSRIARLLLGAFMYLLDCFAKKPDDCPMLYVVLAEKTAVN